jgi:hypothetical protein
MYSLPSEVEQVCQSRHCVPRDLEEDVSVSLVPALVAWSPVALAE